MPKCVIIVENLPVPLDRRVWQEAAALRDAGWIVSVICPATKKYPKYFETIEGIKIFRHPLPIEARSAITFLLEYTVALLHEFRLLFKVNRVVGFDVIQACNPPDLIFLVALPWKLWGKKFVYDHHDICPELLVAKFGNKRLLNAATTAAEKLSFKTANLVISANETFRQIAIKRGRKRPEDVVTVYSIPDRRFFLRSKPIDQTKTGERVIIGYIGIVGAHDGVNNIVLMANHLVNCGVRNFHCVVVGDGPALPDAKIMASNLNLNGYFTFTGYLSGAELLDALSEFHIGIIPDPVNTYNDKISMNKVFEYSAMGLPIVAFNLSEARRLLGDAAIFAARDDAIGLADEVARLISDPGLREELGRRAKAVADANFDWPKEAAKYVSALNGLANPVSAAAGKTLEKESGDF
jgi:glycosyltransferase involved in cell wall biosynthesis